MAKPAKAPQPILPNNLDLERVVLGAALYYEQLAPGVHPRHFYRRAHRTIWLAIEIAMQRHLAPSQPVIHEILRERHELEDVTPATLSALGQDAIRPTEASLASAAEQLEELARRRDELALIHRAARQVLDDPDSFDADRLVADLTATRSTETAIRLIDDVDVVNLPETRFLIQRRLPAAAMTMLFGESGIGKTFVAQDCGLSVATGRPWLGAAVDLRGPVVYVAAEGAVRDRIGGWKIAHKFSLDERVGFYVWPTAVQLVDAPAMGRFLAQLRTVRPVLVIFDTLARCLAGADENSSQDMGQAIANADRLRTDLNATILFLHHTAKNGGAERGSSALRAACDTILQLSKTDDLLQLTCSKQKDGEPFGAIDLQLTAAYQGASSCIVRLASDVAPTEAPSAWQLAVLRVLRDFFGLAGATSKEWFETALESGVKRATFYHARAQLLSKGYVRQAKGRFFATDKGGSPTQSQPSLMPDFRESQAVSA